MIPKPEDYWRALILYGRNASTYKIALGNLLMDYASRGVDRVDTLDLAGDFIDLYMERCRNGKPQLGQSGRKTIVEQEIDSITAGVKRKEDTLDTVRTNALCNMVLQRFHILYDGPISHTFYTLEGDRFIILDDSLGQLAEENELRQSLEGELGSRWDLLEYAFEFTHRNESLDADEYLNHIVRRENRVNLTPLIPTLNGYQQGRCFYCGEELYDIHVDHVIPYQAVMHNEIWNLVLAHSWCNENKLDNVPPLPFIENLITRNEYFIASSHPIKDTLIAQLGATPRQRRMKIIGEYQYAKNKIGRIWGGTDKYNPRNDAFYRDWVRYLG